MIPHENCEGCEHLESTYRARSFICAHKKWKHGCGCPINRWKIKMEHARKVKNSKMLKKIIKTPRRV